jgi:hypothetical protein
MCLSLTLLPASLTMPEIECLYHNRSGSLGNTKSDYRQRQPHIAHLEIFSAEDIGHPNPR